MKCPFCSCQEDKVIDSRTISSGLSIRRRRECNDCGRRYTTFEHIEHIPIVVVKRSKERENFERQKLKSGVIRACEKRPVSIDQIDEIIDGVEESLEKLGQREVDSTAIGELVMNALQKVDEVAYVRFASVYRQFKDVSQFMEELSGLLKKER